MGNMIDLMCILFLAYSFNALLKEASIVMSVVILIVMLILTFKYFKSKNNEIEYKKRTNQQWTQFIELLNHDLKIPTLAQLRAVELLENDKIKDLTKEELISQIKKSCKYTLDMISMVVEAYNFDNNIDKLSYERFNMTELLSNCFESLSRDALEKNITFAYNLKSSDTYLDADKKEIKKVMLNLLSNAINYADRGKELNVTISDCGDKMEISLNSKNFAANLMSGAKYSTIGQSIGIYLCKKIIEIHKGKIYITEDEKKDKNISFCIPKTHIGVYN